MNGLQGLSKLVVENVALAQQRFQNPDFLTAFTVEDGKIVDASYIPVLNHLGIEWKYSFLTRGEGLLAMPWPHTDTWRYLKDAPEDTEIPSPLILSSEGEWSAVTNGAFAGQIIFTPNPKAIQVFAPMISGGTRTGKDKILAKMKRPAYEMPPHKLDTCPLCARSDKENPETHGGLCALTNMYTPYSHHEMIIPTGTFYRKGGDDTFYSKTPEGFLEVLEFALDRFSKFGEPKGVMGKHTGYYAGQNLAHAHFHLYPYRAAIEKSTQ